MTRKVACSEFVKRQTAESGYSHFDGTWEELEFIVYKAMENNNIRPGYKDGVILVDMNFAGDPKRFKSAIINIKDNTKLKSNWAPRNQSEAPYIRIAAHGKKQPAFAVTFVLYRADVLQEDDDRSTDAEWEIVAIKARVSVEEEPMHYYTMARNFLHLKGGTQGNFSAKDFAESIIYWNNHVMCLGKKSWWKKLLGK